MVPISFTPAELLQLQAIVVLGVFVIRDIAATKTAIPLIRNNRFMFVIVTRTIKIQSNTLRDLTLFTFQLFVATRQTVSDM